MACNHSIPVPNIYRRASKIAREVKEGKDSIKNLVFQEKHVNIKAVYALILETFKRDEIITELIEKSNLMKNCPGFNPWLAKILICELLWGSRNKMKSDSKPVQAILKLEQTFRQLLPTCNVSMKSVHKHSIVKPRYARVNTLKITVKEAINNFVEEGWVLISPTAYQNYEAFLQILNNLGPSEFMVDIHIPDLLIFPPKTEFYRHEAYKSGSIILQDKASCLPVHLLSPNPGSIVLDMCAAPGMKTTQLAAMIKNSGTVYAVELNEKREKLLREFVDSTGATCVKTILKDVMKVKNDDCPAEFVLVDPSCSGSGITDRVEVENGDITDRVQRLRKLNNFQSKLLRHALNAFPNAKRVVYSTCSINPEENEDVVRQVLETCKYFKLTDARKLLKCWNDSTSQIFPELGNMCVYATPEKDKTNGFFVAVFERLAVGEKNPFLNVELCKVYDKNKDCVDETTADANLQSDRNLKNKKNLKKFMVEVKQDGENENLNAYNIQINEPQSEKFADSEKKNRKKRKGIQILSDISVINKSESVEVQEREVESYDKIKKKRSKHNKEDLNENISSNDIVSEKADTSIKSIKKTKKSRSQLEPGGDSENQQNLQDGMHDWKKSKLKKNNTVLNDDIAQSDKNQIQSLDKSKQQKKSRRNVTQTELLDESIDVIKIEVDTENQNIDLESHDSIVKEYGNSKRNKRKKDKLKVLEDSLIQCEHENTFENMNDLKIENILGSSKVQESNSSTRKEQKCDRINRNDNNTELKERKDDESILDDNGESKKRKCVKFNDMKNSQSLPENTAEDVIKTKRKKKNKQTSMEEGAPLEENIRDIDENHSLTSQSINEQGKEIEEDIIAKKTKKKKKNKELDSSIHGENDLATNANEGKVKKRKSISQPDEQAGVCETNPVIKKKKKHSSIENESKGSLLTENQPNVVEITKIKKQKSRKTE